MRAFSCLVANGTSCRKYDHTHQVVHSACALCARAASPLNPVTVHAGNIDDRNAEGGPANIVYAGNEDSASSSEP